MFLFQALAIYGKSALDQNQAFFMIYKKIFSLCFFVESLTPELLCINKKLIRTKKMFSELSGSSKCIMGNSSLSFSTSDVNFTHIS